LATGTTFAARYRIVEELGQGSMGRVPGGVRRHRLAAAYDLARALTLARRR
jgi:hypothetical protein